ncbi:MAG: YraN family protein [Deltaproteobacteria bacterium]|nr:YraN family protein [Deltaproteobacteria bacterium]
MAVDRRRQVLGRWGEEQAAAYLEARGLRLLRRNYRCPRGEIDLVAVDGKVLVFCEVKTRRSAAYGLPQEAVGRAKQQQIIRVASWYLQEHGWQGEVRFDVVAVTGTGRGQAEITWLPAAFTT